MAAATQQAPENRAQRAKQTPEKEKSSLKQALHNLPQAAGVAIMAALLVIALFAGNFRALSAATPKAFLRWGDVDSIVEDRLSAAENAKMVASRAALDDLLITPVDNAISAMEAAGSAREISRADQQLTAAVSAMVAEAMEALDSENREMLQSAADDFAEQGSFLRQEAREFNKKAEKAEALYEKLPTRFVLAEPDVYEGI